MAAFAPFNIRASATVNDVSGTITLGGSSQSLLSANTARRGLMVQNQSAGDLWINVNGGAAAATHPSIWVPAGSVFVLDFGQVPTAAVAIYGATTGQAFAAQEYS